MLFLNSIDDDDPFKIPLDVLERVYKNEEINTYLLNLVDDVLFNFFTDTSIKKRMGKNITRFMKSDIEKQDVIATLTETDKIDSLIKAKINPQKINKAKEVLESKKQIL
jgi:hypothetical protein